MMDFIIEYWIQAVFAGILSVLGYLIRQLYKKINQEVAERTAMKTAMIAMLHDMLFQSCQYYIKLGHIPLEDSERVLDNLEMLYNAYSALGGNGTGTAIYKRTKELPLAAENI